MIFHTQKPQPNTQAFIHSTRTELVVKGHGLLLVKDAEGDGVEGVVRLALQEGHLGVVDGGGGMG